MLESGQMLCGQNIWKNTNYFLGLEKHRGKKKVMTTVKTQTGNVVNTKNKIMEAQVYYYEDLYKKKSSYNNR